MHGRRNFRGGKRALGQGAFHTVNRCVRTLNGCVDRAVSERASHMVQKGAFRPGATLAAVCRGWASKADREANGRGSATSAARLREACAALSGAGPVLLGAILLSGCASPGNPRPPSLHLQQVPAAAEAQRLGDQVIVTWDTPAGTTDGGKPEPPLTAVVCREMLPQAARPATAPVSCTPVLRLAAAPGSSGRAAETLPAALLATPALLAYRVELLNARGRSAGLSPPAFAAAGPAPAPAGAAHAQRARGRHAHRLGRRAFARHHAGHPDAGVSGPRPQNRQSTRPSHRTRARRRSSRNAPAAPTRPHPGRSWCCRCLRARPPGRGRGLSLRRPARRNRDPGRAYARARRHPVSPGRVHLRVHVCASAALRPARRPHPVAARNRPLVGARGARLRRWSARLQHSIAEARASPPSPCSTPNPWPPHPSATPP